MRPFQPRRSLQHLHQHVAPADHPQHRAFPFSSDVEDPPDIEGVLISVVVDHTGYLVAHWLDQTSKANWALIR